MIPPSRGRRPAFLPEIVLLVLIAATMAEHLRHGGSERMETVLLVATVVAVVAVVGWRAGARRRAGGLRHDLLSALTVIRGHVELHGRRRPASADEVHELREVVIDEVGRMTERLDDLGDG